MSTIEETIRTIIREELVAHWTGIAAPAAAATPKPRGRPAKGEAAPAADATTAGATAAADPFAEPAAATAPTATEDQVRAALTELKNATTQDNAVKVLKASSGVDNLTELRKTPEKYGLVVAAAKKALPVAAVNTAEVDPFEAASEPVTAEPVKALTPEDVKAACVTAGKRTGQDKVQKILMEMGGKAKNAATGVEGPSLKALDPSKYAAFVAAIAALPTTK